MYPSGTLTSPSPASGKYLSPHLMQTAQEKYASSYTGPPAPGPDGTVPAFPTPDKKNDICNMERMRNVDNNAINVSTQEDILC